MRTNEAPKVLLLRTCFQAKVDRKLSSQSFLSIELTLLDSAVDRHRTSTVHRPNNNIHKENQLKCYRSINDFYYSVLSPDAFNETLYFFTEQREQRVLWHIFRFSHVCMCGLSENDESRFSGFCAKSRTCVHNGRRTFPLLKRRLHFQKLKTSSLVALSAFLRMEGRGKELA